ncbi:DUF6503 family protein [Maribacter sp. PR1]|uniref:DUF6503 family protein n=1 Tax=Maribacter cobaltidurans TaxID=1178778 RepID=A0ABU7IZ93_9FLAO|nr:MULTISPECIES: DUF6503 family protein [Maribacter]MDC6390930.1 DUF6503 family protein [Maribacter sp. PR1]MEE1978322.1 DUF6503 family protein [Maribacter cobaltidurans]
MRYLLFGFIVLNSWLGTTQDLTGPQLLEKAISYHDPNSNWKNFNGNMDIIMTTPNSETRRTHLELNLPESYFKSSVRKGTHTVDYIIDKDQCELLLNNSPDISDDSRDSLQITCERANMMKDYYTYLYGLPMKLKDTGTMIDQKVAKRTFKGKEYLVLSVKYDEAVGKDTWYFYFDPNTYKMEVYQFYHDESKNDGEYILLSEEIMVNGIKMPKLRAWYYNKDDKYLGTDDLVQANPLE